MEGIDVMLYIMGLIGSKGSQAQLWRQKFMRLYPFYYTNGVRDLAEEILTEYLQIEAFIDSLTHFNLIAKYSTIAERRLHIAVTLGL